MNAKQIVKSLIALVVLTSLLLTGCSAVKTETQPEEIDRVGEKIAGYTMPDGYTQQFAVDLLGYQLVSLTGATPSCHIYLVQAPKDTEADMVKLQDKARSMEGEKNRDELRDIRTVETRTATVRGQEVDVSVAEGLNSEDQSYRVVTALFEGRSGPALVNISSPVDLWDWDQVDAFLASIE